MISVKINDVDFLVTPDVSILEACKLVGITVPRFCYHESLSVAGNCRMCLVEVEDVEKPVASCVTVITEDMSIWVDGPFVKKARENVIETLLINHPLDCPICDQAGECDLQDQVMLFGSEQSRFFFTKRGVEDKNCGPLIKTIMTRCIHCTRCIRYFSESSGIDFLGTLNRGTGTEIGGYFSHTIESEISGNVIDLCPVGALTAKPYAFRARPWELRIGESIDTTDGAGSSLYVNFKETEIFRILPKVNTEINQSIVSDKARFSYDATKANRLQTVFLQNKKQEFIQKKWKDLFLLLSDFLKTRVQILVEDDIDTETLVILKAIEQKSRDTFYVSSTRNSVFNPSNLVLYGVSNKISDIGTSTTACLLFSTNIKLESAIVNARIRYQYRNNYIKVCATGAINTANIPTHFIHLNLLNTMLPAEGKCSVLSKLLIESNNPLIVFGTSLSKRGMDFSSLHQHFINIVPTCRVLILYKFCNSFSLAFFGVKNITTRKLKEAKSLFVLNADDTSFNRKDINALKHSIFWFNTHGSALALTARALIPTLLPFEAENTYINLENRPQKTLNILGCTKNARSCADVFTGLFKSPLTMTAQEGRAYYFIFEIAKTSTLFKKFNKIISANTQTVYQQIRNHPLKIEISDFYCTTRYTKNSSTMTLCSQESRKLNYNFLEV